MNFWGKTVKADATPTKASLTHFVSKVALDGPFPANSQIIYLGMGCFWGAERLFWSIEGVYITAVGYQGGFDELPTYEKVCSGKTGHAEVVKIVFDPTEITLGQLLKIFWEQHDPTQGMRQGNDVGTQYRSAIFTSDKDQMAVADFSKNQYQQQLHSHGFGLITTEISIAQPFYFAEEYHQQYLAKNPSGYCGIKGSGVICPISAPPVA